MLEFNMDLWVHEAVNCSSKRVAAPGTDWEAPAWAAPPWFTGSVFCWVAKSCPILWDPMDCSTLGFSVLHYLPGVCSNSCPLSQWCHPTISSSVALFSSSFQSFPASGSFSMSELFTSHGWSTGAPASASVLPMNIQGWFPLGWTGWISLVRSPVLITRHTQQTRVPQAKSVRWSHSLPNLRNAQALAGREGGGWSWGPPGVGTGTGVLSHRGRWPRAGV